LSVALLF